MIKQAQRECCFIMICLFLMTLTSATEACPTHHMVISGHSTESMALEAGQSFGLKGELFKTICPLKAVDDHRLTVGFGILTAYGLVEETSRAWAITHHELYTQGVLEGLWSTGNGSHGLKIAIGGGWIFEHQTRLQAERLNLGDRQESLDLTLQRSAQIFVPIVTLSPVTQLKLFNFDWGALGMKISTDFHYRLQSNDGSHRMRRWAWGLSLGVFADFGASTAREEKKL